MTMMLMELTIYNIHNIQITLAQVIYKLNVYMVKLYVIANH